MRLSNLGLMLCAAVVPLFAILLVYQVYASPNTAFLDTVYHHSILSVISPVKLQPIIRHVLESDSFLSLLKTSIKLSSLCEFLDSCLSALTSESFNTLASTAQWATDKLFTCEISYMITIAITSAFTKFFRVAYLRIFISTSSLLVTYISHVRIPRDRRTLREAKQQLYLRICALCCIVFTAIEYTMLVRATICILRSLICEFRGTEGKTRMVVKCISVGVTMAATWPYTIGWFIWRGAKNVLESWRFVEVAREKEAARIQSKAIVMEKMVNAMKRRDRFIGDEKEEQRKEEFLRDILRLYDYDETEVDNTNSPKDSPRG